MTKIKVYGPILLLTLSILAVLCACVNYQMEEDLLSYVKFEDELTGMELVPYYDMEEKKYYLFLPSHIKPENVKISLFDRGYVEFFSEESFFGNDLSHVPLKKDVVLYSSYLWYKRTGVFQFWQCSELSSLFLEIKDGSLEYLNKDIDRSTSVEATIVSKEGTILLSTTAKMGGRGNTTWRLPKRPYDLNLHETVELEGFGQVSKLCLLAEFYDETMLRNALALYGGNQQGIAYCPSYQHVNVYVNGEFLGLYGLADRDGYKNLIESDGVQGAFLISNKIGDRITLGSRRKAEVLYGDQRLVQEKISAFEEALSQADWDRCAELIDMESFARKILLEEFFGNEDMIHASQYFYVNREGLICCMVPWDFDLSMGNTNTYFNNRQYYGILSKHFAFRENTDWYLKWYGLLLEWPEFRKTLVRIMETDYDDAFVEGLLAYLRETNKAIDQSRNIDKYKWRDCNIYEIGDLRISGLEGSDSYENYFVNYFSKRRDILYDYFCHKDDYCIVEFQDAIYANFCIPKGAKLSDYVEDSTVLNVPNIKWYTLEGLAPTDISIVTEDTIFYAKYEDLSEDGGE